MKETSTLKRFISSLPLMTIMVICIAIINLGVYYSFFNFNIFEYIELDELIPVLLKDILVLIAFLPLFSVLLYRFSPVYIRRQITANNRFSMCSFALALITLLSFAVSAWIDYHKDKITWTGFLVLCILPLTAVLLRYLPQWLYGLFSKSRVALHLMLYCQIAVVLAGVSTFDGLRNHLIVEDARHRENVTLTLNDNSQIRCDTNHYYIGKTKAGVFYFNPKKNTVEIYPASTIKLITVQ